MDKLKKHEVPELGLDLSTMNNCSLESLLKDFDWASSLLTDEPSAEANIEEPTKKISKFDNDEEQEPSPSSSISSTSNSTADCVKKPHEIPELGLDLSGLENPISLLKDFDWASNEHDNGSNNNKRASDLNLDTPLKKQKSVSSFMAETNLEGSESDNDEEPAIPTTISISNTTRQVPSCSYSTSQRRNLNISSHSDLELDGVDYRNMIHVVSNRPDVTRHNLNQSRIDDNRNMLDVIDNAREQSLDEILEGLKYVRGSYSIRDKDLYFIHRPQIEQCIKMIHALLKSRPKVTDKEDTPSRLRTELLDWQKHALRFLKWREESEPYGGILADDMGLGKTLTIIALIMDKINVREILKKPLKCKIDHAATLIVCTKSILLQWQQEFETRTRGGISILVHHGLSKAKAWREVLSYNVVLTTYNTVANEYPVNGFLFQIFWSRIVLDEAHTIRNCRTQISEACCNLMSKHRWLITGTPIHNKEEDLFPLFRFLKLRPFDDWKVFSKWAKGPMAYGRIQVIMKALLLRRTKVEMKELGQLQLPEKYVEEYEIELDRREMAVYQQLLAFCQTMLVMFLNARAIRTGRGQIYDLNDRKQMDEFKSMRNKLRELNHNKVSSHEILVLFLRLRQMCCHPNLSRAILKDEERADQILEDEEEGPSGAYINELLHDVTESDVLEANNPIFSPSYQSSKLKALIKILQEKFIDTKCKDKIVIVSEWTSYLDLIESHVAELGITCGKLDGSVSMEDRNELVERFNNPDMFPKILLLSLMAGGVGLNLVGANHIFMMSVHWNPQQEKQAEDRVYRVGQKKPVYVYKFRCSQTIEDRIFDLQKAKLKLASSILHGGSLESSSRLTIEDIRKLFGIDNDEKFHASQN